MGTTDLKNFKCPLCNKSLANNEYGRAMNKLESEVEERFHKQDLESRKKFEQEKKEREEIHKQLLVELKDVHSEQIKNLKNELQDLHKEDITSVKKFYDDMSKRNEKKFDEFSKKLEQSHKKEIQDKEKQIRDLDKQQKTFKQQAIHNAKRDFEGKLSDKNKEIKEMLLQITKLHKESNESSKQLRNSHTKEIQEKDTQIKELLKEQPKFKEQAYENAKLDFKTKLHNKTREIDERDLQISRLKREVDDLANTITKTQSELKGEVGELNLYEILTNAFPNDHFKRQSRGQQTGDLFQTIRTKTGKLDTQIIYDNKEDTTVTTTDLKKAKNYQKIHNTKYVLIVSTKIPKTYAPNGIYGRKDGVLIVNPKIIIEVATRCREFIIEIGRISEGARDREAKEARLFDYVLSPEFATLMASVYQTNEKMRQLQDQEEKTHLRWWKDRKMLRDQLIGAYMEIETGVESITQKKPEIEEIKVENS